MAAENGLVSGGAGFVSPLMAERLGRDDHRESEGG